MKSALLCLGAILLDRFLPPPRWHPLAAFARLAGRAEVLFQGPDGLAPAWCRLRGGAAAVLLIVPVAALAGALSAVPYLGAAVDLGLLYLAFGATRLTAQAEAVRSALAAGEADLAWERVEALSSPEVEVLDEEAISLVTVEAVLERGAATVLGVLFWFVAAGAPGLIAYRLSGTLRRQWQRRRCRHFGSAAAALNELLDWLPARLSALTYGLVGERAAAWRCWRAQAASWRASNALTVLAAGAGALGLQLGGALPHHDYVLQRPAVGEGLLPRAPDIQRALNLVGRALGLWAGLLVTAGCLGLLLGS